MSCSRQTMPQLRAAIQEAGATLREWRGPLNGMAMEAPAGEVWTSEMVHEAVSYGRGTERSALMDLAAIANAGTEPCAIAGCEWCADRRSEEGSRPKA